MTHLQEYQQDLEQTEILPHEEAVVLHGRMKEGDISARNKLVESCLRFSYHRASRFGYGLEEADRVSEASIAVVAAVEAWEPERGRLTTIVGHAVDNHLKECAWRQGHNGVYIPLRTLNQVDRVKNGEAVEDIVAPMGRGWRIRRQQDITSAAIASQVNTLSCEYDDDDEFTKQPLAREEHHPGICISDIEDIFKRKKNFILSQDRKIFRRRHGLNGEPQTLQGVADALDITLAEVKRSLKKTSHHLQQRKKCKRCKRCSKEFEPNFLHQKYCSTLCQQTKKRVVHKPRQCSHCEDTFAPLTGKQIFCSKKCGQANHHQRTRRKYLPNTTFTRQCHCGNVFTTKQRHKIYCKPKCANRVAYLRKKDIKNERQLPQTQRPQFEQQHLSQEGWDRCPCHLET